MTSPVEPVTCARPPLSTYAPAEPSRFIPEEHWAVFREVLAAARATGVPFALGGGLAISFYTGLWRPSKDLDLYILRADREAVIRAVTGLGLRDYFDAAPYDRAWIYRAYGRGVIVDLIWALANGIADVDHTWLGCGVVTEVECEPLPLISPEEMFWSKVHVVQRDRCDWPDLVNLLLMAGPAFDWQRLLRRLGSEQPLLAAVLALFAWLAPGRSAQLPKWLWSRLGLRPPEDGPVLDRRRVDLLDSRPWVTPAAVNLEAAASETRRRPRPQTLTVGRAGRGPRSAGTSKA